MSSHTNKPSGMAAQAEDSGLACMVELLVHFGISVRCRDLRRWLGLHGRPQDLFGMMETAALLGLDATPLEGPFEELPGCPFPVIVPMQASAEVPAGFVVVRGLEPGRVHLFDPLVGETTLDEAGFRARWEGPEGQGDVLALAPNSDWSDIGLTLERLARPSARFALALGLVPPWPTKILFVLVGLLLLGCVPWADSRWLYGALALSVQGALWSWLFGQSCGNCFGARRLSGGLPMAALGLVGYGSLLVLGGLSYFGPVHQLIFGAAGAHLTLLAILFRGGITCWACRITALGAWLAVGYFVWEGQAGWQDALLVGVGALLAWVIVRLARYHQRLAQFRGTFEVARSVWAEHPPAPNSVRAVVYTRHKCAYCLVYQTMIRPALAQHFGEMLVFEERDAGNLPLEVPTMILAGTRRVIVTDLRGEASYEVAKAAVSLTLAPSSQEEATAVLLFAAEDSATGQTD